MTKQHPRLSIIPGGGSPSPSMTKQHPRLSILPGGGSPSPSMTKHSISSPSIAKHLSITPGGGPISPAKSDHALKSKTFPRKELRHATRKDPDTSRTTGPERASRISSTHHRTVDSTVENLPPDSSITPLREHSPMPSIEKQFVDNLFKGVQQSSKARFIKEGNTSREKKMKESEVSARIKKERNALLRENKESRAKRNERNLDLQGYYNAKAAQAHANTEIAHLKAEESKTHRHSGKPTAADPPRKEEMKSYYEAEQARLRSKSEAAHLKNFEEIKAGRFSARKNFYESELLRLKAKSEETHLKEEIQSHNADLKSRHQKEAIQSRNNAALRSHHEKERMQSLALKSQKEEIQSLALQHQKEAIQSANNYADRYT
jgi:hypothetical protein